MPRDPWVIITEVYEPVPGLEAYRYEPGPHAPDSMSPATIQREAWRAVQQLQAERRSATIQ